MSEQTERELFKAITLNNLNQAIQRVDEEGYPSNRKSSTYDLVYKEITYPPKYIMSLAGYFADNNFINHNEFSGGEQSVCFEILRGFGFTISPKSETKNFKTSKDSPNIHLKYTFKAIGNELDITKFKSCFVDYIDYCKRSQWLTYREGYKFKFARWLYSRVNFEKQNDEQILQICRDSQNQVYTDESNEKGINFITSALKYGDSFINIQDIGVLRKIYEGELLEDGAFKNSPLTFPKFSCWAGTLIPSEYKIYSSEELTSGIAYLFNLETYPKAGVSSFNLANTCLSIIADAAIDYYKEDVKELINLIFPDSEDVLDCDLSWLIQDFGLYLNRIFFAKDVSYYWVNQGSQYKNELDNGCIVAPIGSIHHHKRLCSLIEGDIIIHYAGGAIQATSVVTKEFVQKQSPYSNNGEDCFVVEVDYTTLDKPISIDVLKEKFSGNQSVLPKKYSPFTSNLSIVQSYCLDFNKESYDLIFKGINNRSYWLYAPGRKARNWDEFYSEGIMGLGWDEIGDLTQYLSRDQIKNALVEAYGGDGSKKNNISANDDFLNKIRIGDVVIAKKGRGELLGYGIVTSDYIFDKNRSEYRKIRKVNWKLKGNWKVDFSLVLKTLTDITKYESEHPEYEYYYERLFGIMENKFANESKKEPLNIPLNTILYGPPGTGKTYQTKELAVQIAHPEFLIDPTWSEKEKREEINKKYKSLFDSGQVLFTTFHQSFSYEDFVEGIKPETIDKNVTYDTIPGVFKEFCEKAGTKSASNFEQVLSQFIKELGEQESITINTGTIEFDVFYRGGKTFKINPKESKNTNPQYPASIENILKVYKGEADEGMYNPTYVKGILSHLYEVYKLKPYDVLESGNEKNFVLIIDEINRGNVSAIFGELITLLEPDKRLGEVEALKVKLPYSKSHFGVPPNIYIIGTMNTADRSVEALDTALRRRFSFMEVMPKPELLERLEFNDFNLNQVLQTINERIEVLLDRDHTIGHSYFMGLRSGDTNGLLAVFENKIIPLLQEYFYQDYEKIALVLGAGFVKLKVVQNVKFANFKGLDEPEIVAQFDLIDEIIDIELAVKQLLNLE